MIQTSPSAPDAAAEGWDSVVVLGLGNPGPDYAGNRHNVGAMVVAEIAAEQGVSLKRGPSRLARVVCAPTRLAGARVLLARLTTYMNESGQAVRPLLDYFKAEPATLIVVHDELDLPFGAVRIKQGGGDNGHNGLRSITASLTTPDYVRIRIGIGRPVGRQSPADFVLRDYSSSERAELPAILDQAARAVTLILERGLVAAQNELHRP
ncbi:MAG: aminoacyl-tRNA hydrolase [Geodermatophilaceae bacterium]|nr:aminoacyl-tRNA hydrolase [Geodermatophilaceae bacterium]